MAIVAQATCLPLLPNPCAMVGPPYSIYRSDFRTKQGVRRVYVGLSDDLERRFGELGRRGKKQPKWCSGGFIEGTIKPLLLDLPTLASALAAEALYAARAIVAAPTITRGGPWPRPTLYEHQKKEYETAARCNTMAELFAFARTLPQSSNLVKHLKNAKFVPVEGTPAMQPKPPRGAPIDLFFVARKRQSGRSRKSGTSTKGTKSGVCGHDCRMSLIKDGKMKVGDDRERRLHRGRRATTSRGRGRPKALPTRSLS